MNWGILVLGIFVFYSGFLFGVQFVRAYKRHVPMATQGSAAFIIWLIIILVVVGLPLFFFTGLAKIGIPFLIGCTLSITGILLHLLAAIGGAGIAKQDVDIAISNMPEAVSVGEATSRPSKQRTKAKEETTINKKRERRVKGSESVQLESVADELEAQVLKRLRASIAKQAIIKELTDSGISEVSAKEFVDYVEKSLRRNPRKPNG